MEFKPTFLYIKKHNKTGLKYLGKSVKKSREAVHEYTGSGKIWQKHLNKHGEDYTTIILGRFIDKDRCKKFGYKFSKKNNIVESDEWANLMPESGCYGGTLPGEKNGMYGKTLTKEERWKCGKASRGKKFPEHSKRMSGKGNPMYGKTYHTHGLKRYIKETSGKTYEEIHGEEKGKKVRKK